MAKVIYRCSVDTAHVRKVPGYAKAPQVCCNMPMVVLPENEGQFATPDDKSRLRVSTKAKNSQR